MIHMIAAVARNGGIGRDNKLLCHISADLKRFKELTMGHDIIMGRKTFESLPGMLPGRRHIVLSRQKGYGEGQPDLVVCHSLEEIGGLLDEKRDYFVIGGASVYAEFMERADSLYLTKIDREFEADTFFPPFDEDCWQVAAEERHDETETCPAFSFVHYVRK